MKRMLLIIACATLTANVFAAGGIRDKLAGKTTNRQQQNQQQEDVVEESTVALMDKLKSMKPGENWVNNIRINDGAGFHKIAQLYTRVGGGFIVQTLNAKTDYKTEPRRDIVSEVRVLSSLFVSDKEMFGDK